ncbi:hypothetical protein [Ectobacillus ponti]|uniref:Uncharacterized protein n=1 Tax=Ectobacillus ponti TaxID=2961894 RepID=A0AA41XBD1_9BACI|nr:hypothetical protein [Ectobacillus ponti]MCP8970563.1 hypothetical protein [Ectobacillus ponti]
MDLADILILVGIVLLSIGCGMIYLPLSFAVPGIILLCIGLKITFLKPVVAQKGGEKT